jgi:hypothetical protein
MGFRKCGEWRLEQECIKCTLVVPAPAKNVLYAFISEEQVLYIGKTVGSLTKRMYYYQKPGPSQSTNKHCNSRIRDILASGAM